MDWDKAKNMVIVFFTLLNVMLSVLLYQSNLKYSLTGEQEKNIVNVLAENNISLYSKVISRYEPMRILEVSFTGYDEKSLKKIFLDDENAELKSEGEAWRLFENGEKRLTISEFDISFDDESKDNYQEQDLDGATALCDRFLADKTELGKGYKLDVAPYYRGEDIIVEYRQNINGFVIYDNYIIFTIDNYGIKHIDYATRMPVGFTGDKREICSSDEALFSFLQAMQMQSLNKPQRIIEKLDLVYYVVDAGQLNGQASPYYRIYYTDESDEIYTKRLCVIDAYLNTWKLI